ncbi:dUTP diphosphatase [Candidatus Wolfebacteria bacterium]|nr:dUTP diphosphatase [Candidatus Wolfebacteria bacterium]
MVIKIQKIDFDAIIPNYANESDAGLDLYSVEDVILKPGERHAVKTGIKMEIPEGYVGLIWDKSGLAVKNGAKTMAGVVDAGYRGEIKIVLINLGEEDFVIKKNSKIAQMLIQKIEHPKIEIVSELNESQRGENGFGSTGL